MDKVISLSLYFTRGNLSRALLFVHVCVSLSNVHLSVVPGIVMHDTCLKCVYVL